MEHGHVWRGYEQARRAGILRFRVRPDGVLGIGFCEGGRSLLAVSQGRDRSHPQGDRPFGPEDCSLDVARRNAVEPGRTHRNHANLWRISNDFWDNWRALYSQFARLNSWTPFRGPGHWPDADMLPLGNVRAWQTRDNWTHFTQDEQFTLMTLWCIARSPLIMGGNMPKNDDFTLALMTNDEVLAVNQNSTTTASFSTPITKSRGSRTCRDQKAGGSCWHPGSLKRLCGLRRGRCQKTNTLRCSTRCLHPLPVVGVAADLARIRRLQQRTPPRPSPGALPFLWPISAFPGRSKSVICGITRILAPLPARSRRKSIPTARAFTGFIRRIENGQTRQHMGTTGNSQAMLNDKISLARLFQGKQRHGLPA